MCKCGTWNWLRKLIQFEFSEGYGIFVEQKGSKKNRVGQGA